MTIFSTLVQAPTEERRRADPCHAVISPRHDWTNYFPQHLRCCTTEPARLHGYVGKVGTNWLASALTFSNGRQDLSKIVVAFVRWYVTCLDVPLLVKESTTVTVPTALYPCLSTSVILRDRLLPYAPLLPEPPSWPRVMTFREGFGFEGSAAIFRHMPNSTQDQSCPDTPSQRTNVELSTGFYLDSSLQ
jgi:hypothetical protein